MDKVLVSVIIPVHNEGAYVQEAVSRIFQSFHHL